MRKAPLLWKQCCFHLRTNSLSLQLCQVTIFISIALGCRDLLVAWRDSPRRGWLVTPYCWLVDVGWQPSKQVQVLLHCHVRSRGRAQFFIGKSVLIISTSPLLSRVPWRWVKYSDVLILQHVHQFQSSLLLPWSWNWRGGPKGEPLDQA